MLRGIPGLVAVAVIFLVARFVAAFLDGLFDRVERGALTIRGLYPETVSATRRIVAGLVWLVALAASWPYIPGSDSSAVKGLSLLVGVMLSLGSTGLVSQVMSGLAVIYSRALSAGDTVRVGDVEGVVSAVGLLSTKIVTVPGEEVTFPNSVLLGGAVRNYTRLAGGAGPLVTTSVTIGYDAPWRQVHDLLIGAARETPSLRRDPAPFVLQRGLDDFYVEYQLLVRLEGDPLQRPRVLSDLHARVQDAFNAAGVQIMSPHFFMQPEKPVLVPPERRDGEHASPPQRQRG
jgi:small-conductance mechanosensitive channel